MRISDQGMALIKKWEGYHKRMADGRCVAYLDTLAHPDVWTIGWGCTKDVRPGMIWTQEEATEALKREIATHEEAVLQAVTVPITQQHFDALVSFTYNVGNGALRRSTLLKKLNKGDYDGAEGQFKRWNRAGGTIWRGLVRRRREEAIMFAEGTAEMENHDDQMWWERTDDVIAVAEPLPQRPQASREPVSPGVAAAGTAAASGAAAVASHAPEGTLASFTSTVTAFTGFAGSNIGIIVAVTAVVALVIACSQLLRNVEFGK